MCWSPDGKYVVTGGQDDLISIWCASEKRLIARAQGHQSWVTSVAFDLWRCDEKNYRFGSVGEDCRLCLWDFNVGMLHRPKAVSCRPHTNWVLRNRFSSTEILTSVRHRPDTVVRSRPALQTCSAQKPKEPAPAGFGPTRAFRLVMVTKTTASTIQLKHGQ